MLKFVLRNMNKILFWLGSVILTAILLVLGSLYMFTDSPSSLMKFLFTYQAVKENYFHEVTDDVLFEGASNGMVSALDDPHSMILSGDASLFIVIPKSSSSSACFLLSVLSCLT